MVSTIFRESDAPNTTGAERGLCSTSLLPALVEKMGWVVYTDFSLKAPPTPVPFPCTLNVASVKCHDEARHDVAYDTARSVGSSKDRTDSMAQGLWDHNCFALQRHCYETPRAELGGPGRLVGRLGYGGPKVNYYVVAVLE